MSITILPQPAAGVLYALWPLVLDYSSRGGRCHMPTTSPSRGVDPP